MAWLWSSFEEFKKRVYPIEIDKPGFFEETHDASQFENLERLFEAIKEFSFANDKLRREVNRHKKAIIEDAKFEQAWQFIWDIIRTGETILLYHKKLNDSSWAYDFRKEKSLAEHWDSYSVRRRRLELDRLIKAAEKLQEGFYKLMSEDRRFLINDIALPDFLMKDFILSRNLFSVGFDEVGLLIAGRGLEGVLREIARTRNIKIKFVQKNKELLASEADFSDLIETFYRLKWQKDRSRFINQETKNLLHFLRSIRNSSAHPNRENSLPGPSRELASVIAKTANTLWSIAKQSRTRVFQKTIEKDW